MGKIQGIFQFTGKIGQVVGMKGDNGERYAREYVKTANPDTKGQQDVRTIMSLAGKISSLTPAAIITGLMGANKRQRRSNFVRNIALNSTIATVNDQLQASLAPEKLLLSDGQQMEMPTLTKSMSRNILSITAASLPEALDACIVVAYGISEDGEYVDCKYRTLTSTVLQLAISMADDVRTATVYLIPVVKNEAVGSTRYAEALEALQANSDFAVTSGGTGNSALAYEHSTFEGVVANA